MILRQFDSWSSRWKEFFSGLGSVEAMSVGLFAYATVGVIVRLQDLPASNPMYWRSFLFFIGAFLAFIYWAYPGLDDVDTIDNAQYVRLVILSAVIGTTAYVLWRFWEFATL